MSASRARLRVVIDGSNLATEGRTDPSLSQLDDAITAFREENPRAEIVVVVDASFGHRVASGERAHFKERELDGTIVTPPAGAIGRGDAFILKIADRISGVVLSNDSFQEFHAIYPWLFDEGRLVGGKPVPGVGWIFTPRLPVRGTKSARSVKKLAVLMPDGVAPSIGATITPAKPTAKSAEGKAPAAKKTIEKVPRSSKRAAKVLAAEALPAAKVSVTKIAAKPAKRAEVPKRADVATKADVAKKAEVAKKAPAKRASAKKSPTTPTAKRTARAAAPVKGVPGNDAAPVPAVAPSTTAPTVALRRGRQPVNPEDVFARFRAAFKLGSRLEGEVTTFTSHGAVITVTFKGGQVECYAPTTLLGDPPPARARDVLKRGDRRTFRLITVDADRRIAELALT
ncbi:MAG: hypothetical protein KGJ92_04040 [Actinomycetales bacterium]|nr:hypothetical protein [Actinomycetales bacterium]